MRRLSLAGAAVLGLLLALPSPALGVTWSVSANITTSRNGFADAGLLATSSAINVAYEESRGGINRTFFRRSTNGGTTWSTPLQLSRTSAPYAWGAALSGSGAAMAAAWGEQTSSGAYVVVYAGSIDGGVTWSARTTLSASAGNAGGPRIARDGSGHIAAVWTDNTTGAVIVRISLNGGAAWGGRISLATTTNQIGDPGFPEGYADVAFGTGTWYVAYFASPTSLRIRRSTNLGAAWGSYAVLTTSAFNRGLDLAASGARAIIGYERVTATDAYAAYRRTTNSGGTWAAEAALGALSSPPSFIPVVDVTSTTWRSAYEQCATEACLTTKTNYKESSTGTTWSATSNVSGTARPFNYPAGVGFGGGKVVVLYNSFNADIDDEDVVVRVGV
jgi:hypothetical protein